MTYSTPGIRHEHLLAVISNQPGPGNFLRTVLIVMVVGAIFLAWLLLRGYRQGNETQDAPAREAERVPASRPAEAAATGGTDRTDEATAGPGTSPAADTSRTAEAARGAEAPGSAEAGERSSSED
ncbi:hypothetical protein [Streptomyces sp. SID11385]|uniref:hypothetical protein n=1 Tax=Streptomyces sp. SID11385 TaxID=2706031 RepID=UPI0013CBC6B4|nr:hypothetical protein [Streptomyces sp. SID11385]NEA43570.1 hypothetical protein [Streptomyces sp. SID11385]